MARKLVKFHKGWSRYNRGETAAFGAETALKLTEGKSAVGKIVGDAADPSTRNSILKDARLDAVLTRMKELDDGGTVAPDTAIMAAKEADLNQRAQALADREKALEEREANLAAAGETATADPDTPETATEKPKGNGEPPKQGAKK